MSNMTSEQATALINTQQALLGKAQTKLGIQEMTILQLQVALDQAKLLIEKDETPAEA